MLRRIKKSVPTSGRSRRKHIALGPNDAEHLPLTDPSLRYHIASGKKYFEDIPSLVQDHEGDPAVEVCVPIFPIDLTSNFTFV